MREADHVHIAPEVVAKIKARPFNDLANAEHDCCPHVKKPSTITPALVRIWLHISTIGLEGLSPRGTTQPRRRQPSSGFEWE